MLKTSWVRTFRNQYIWRLRGGIASCIKSYSWAIVDEDVVGKLGPSVEVTNSWSTIPIQQGQRIANPDPWRP